MDMSRRNVFFGFVRRTAVILFLSTTIVNSNDRFRKIIIKYGFFYICIYKIIIIIRTRYVQNNIVITHDREGHV